MIMFVAMMELLIITNWQMMQNKYVNITSEIIHFSSKLKKTNKLK